MKPQTYIRVVNLPYDNHLLAKNILAKAISECHVGKTTEIKQTLPSSKFATSKRSIIRALFMYNAPQIPGYCPADIIKIKMTSEIVSVYYYQRQQYYKGIEEL